jgi:pimeloyl-ACP methyl ester carboxylesterase
MAPAMPNSLTPRWRHLPGRPVRTLQAGTARAGSPDVVVVPGLGALGYLLPTVRACSAWARVHLLDVPGFGHRATARCPATLADVARTVADWLDVVPDRPVLLVGHSTGAQAAQHAALAVPDRVAALSLAGPTFPPEARQWRPLAARIARTARHETPRLIPATAPDYLRGRRRVLTLLRTAMADVPEQLTPRLACPLLVVRGEHDAVCPAPWAARLAAAAPHGRVVTLPGAHNFPYDHPAAASTALRESLPQ